MKAAVFFDVRFLHMDKAANSRDEKMRKAIFHWSGLSVFGPSHVATPCTLLNVNISEC